MRAGILPYRLDGIQYNTMLQTPLLQVTQSYAGQLIPNGDSGQYAPGIVGSVFLPGPQVANGNGGQMWPNNIDPRHHK